MLAARSGEALTFSSLAIEAQVSRRTLYVHWGSIQQVIREVIALRRTRQSPRRSDLPPAEVLRQLLTAARDEYSDPISAIATSLLLGQAAQDASAVKALAEMANSGLEEFRESLGPISAVDYAQLVGPLFLSAYLQRQPADDDLIEELVLRGLALLESSNAFELA